MSDSETREATADDSIRTAARAIIVDDGEVLLVRNEYDGDVWYLPPGGRQRHGETLHETLQREAKEEIGTEVEIGPLSVVRDYIADNHEPRGDEGTHQIDLMFSCSVTDRSAVTGGSDPDVKQAGLDWIPLSDLHRVHVFPRQLADVIPSLSAAENRVYLGDVN